MFVATAIIWICRRITTEFKCQLSWIDPTFVPVEVILFLTSRDTLRKHQQRTKQLLTAVVELRPTDNTGRKALERSPAAIYNVAMIRINDEQRAALQQNPEGVSCEDTDSARTYFVVEESVHLRAMQALKHQQDLEAIRRGVAQMDAGSGTPVAEVRQQLARELGFSVKGS